jgi:hypothetical protein
VRSVLITDKLLCSSAVAPVGTQTLQRLLAIEFEHLLHIRLEARLQIYVCHDLLPGELLTPLMYISLSVLQLMLITHSRPVHQPALHATTGLVWLSCRRPTMHDTPFKGI